MSVRNIPQVLFTVLGAVTKKTSPFELKLSPLLPPLHHSTSTYFNSGLFNNANPELNDAAFLCV